MKEADISVLRTSPDTRRMTRPWAKCPGATSCTVMAGSVVRLNASSHSCCWAGGHVGSGGVMWYQDGASGSYGPADDIMAKAHRRAGGVGATRPSPARPGTRVRHW